MSDGQTKPISRRAAFKGVAAGAVAATLNSSAANDASAQVEDYDAIVVGTGSHYCNLVVEAV
jgi:menaquinone-dependent protoporphyrinogen IX oxidase